MCAGTQVLHSLTLRLVRVSKRSVSALAGRATVEAALGVLVLSLCVVMAGSGDLEVVRIVRYLRSRVGQSHSTGERAALRIRPKL